MFNHISEVDANTPIGRLIPIDAFSQELNMMAWRMNSEETLAMESMFQNTPHGRVMKVVSLAISIAARDPEFRDVLRNSTTVQELRKMEMARRPAAPIAESATEQASQPGSSASI